MQEIIDYIKLTLKLFLTPYGIIAFLIIMGLYALYLFVICRTHIAVSTFAKLITYPFLIVYGTLILMLAKLLEKDNVQRFGLFIILLPLFISFTLYFIKKTLFKQKYWVNNIEIDSENVKYGQKIIGLYRGGRWKGKGSFSGWYSHEFMKNAVLLGYFIIECPRTISKGENHIKEVILEKPKRYKRLTINSLFTQHRLCAENDGEALDMFFSEKWDDESSAFQK